MTVSPSIRHKTADAVMSSSAWTCTDAPPDTRIGAACVPYTSHASAGFDLRIRHMPSGTRIPVVPLTQASDRRDPPGPSGSPMPHGASAPSGSTIVSVAWPCTSREVSHDSDHADTKRLPATSAPPRHADTTSVSPCDVPATSASRSAETTRMSEHPRVC